MKFEKTILNRIVLIFWSLVITPAVLATLWLLNWKLYAVKSDSITTFAGVIYSLTAPFLALLNAILIYLAFIKQSESNTHQKNAADFVRHEANFRIIYEAIKEFTDKSADYLFEITHIIYKENEYVDFPLFTAHLAKLIKDDDWIEIDESYRNDLIKFSFFIKEFDRIFLLIDSLETTEEYKKVCIMGLKVLQANHYLTGFSRFNNFVPSNSNVVSSTIINNMKANIASISDRINSFSS